MISSGNPTGASRPQYPMYIEQNGKLQEFDDANVALTVQQGTSFDVYVPENSGSTGYRWSASLGDKERQFLTVTDRTWVLPGLKPTAMRAIPMHEFTVKVAPSASNSSPFQMELELQRPFAETVPPVAVKNLQINVIAATPH